MTDPGPNLRREQRHYNVGTHAPVVVYVYRRRHRHARLPGELLLWCRLLARVVRHAHRALARRDRG